MSKEPDDGERGGSSIDYQRSTFENGAAPWKDPQVLGTLYHEHDLSQSEIADELGTSQPNISNWMDKFNIERDLPMHLRDRSISRSIREDGRVQYQIPNGDGEVVSIYESQIVALGFATVETVFRDDSEIDHLLHSPLKLNFEENLLARPETDHRKRHSIGKGALPNTKLLTLVYGEPDGTVPEFFSRLDQWGNWWADIERLDERDVSPVFSADGNVSEGETAD
ncbi:hypothetical protein [Halorientalis salina]|uniref:hypothetical protein n=1 Tax=Halorientalis salina TaxID=2932266 RepID=UPI0010ACDFFA|nr:hypothetical protein [Halorientalis salina]